MNIDIKKELREIGINEVNYGACTGTVWKETKGDRIDSFSPSDGT